MLHRGFINITDECGSFILAIHNDFTLFGEKSSIFDQKRQHNARSSINSSILKISGPRFLELLESGKEMRFSQNLSSRIRMIEGVFTALTRFQFELRAAAYSGCFEIRNILSVYRNLEPAIHCGASVGSPLDIDGWSYAINRLPKNINSLFSFILSSLPMDIERAAHLESLP